MLKHPQILLLDLSLVVIALLSITFMSLTTCVSSFTIPPLAPSTFLSLASLAPLYLTRVLCLVAWTLMTLSAPWEPREGLTAVVDAQGDLVVVGGLGYGGVTYGDTWRSSDQGGERSKHKNFILPHFPLTHITAAALLNTSSSHTMT